MNQLILLCMSCFLLGWPATAYAQGVTTHVPTPTPEGFLIPTSVGLALLAAVTGGFATMGTIIKRLYEAREEQDKTNRALGDVRPTKHVPPVRTPLFFFGQTLTDSGANFTGYVDTIYADYWAALDCRIVTMGWFEEQEAPISTKDQVFYGLTATDGKGAILAPEDRLRECAARIR